MRTAQVTQHRARIVALLALCLSLGAPVHAESVPLGADIWSMQLDGGLYAPMEASGASPTGGVRYCKHIGSHLQAGMLSA